MPPSAGWGAVRHRPRQKIGAKLNQSILEMALVSQCQGERLRERDQAGAGRQGPGGRHHCRGTARYLLAPHGAGQPHTVGMGVLPLPWGAEQDGVPIQPAGKAEPSADCIVPCLSFPTQGIPCPITTSPGEGGQLRTGRKGPEGMESPTSVPICTPTPYPRQSVPGWEGRCRARETKTPALDTNIDGSSLYKPRSLAN